jgi:hypothetical protein
LAADVRFGSKADIEAPSHDVLFTPKADIGCALCEVCFVPKADVVAPGPLERRHRSKSLPLAVNEDPYEHRCEGEDDQKAAEYHREPNTR